MAKQNDREAVTTSVKTAVEQEIRAAVMLAKQFPRSEDAARQKLMTSAARTVFADECTYEFPRGQTTVSGPSIKMAREFARLWGNIRFGCKITADDEDNRSIVGWAWDLESNSYEECPDTFRKLIQRKRGPNGATVWEVPDERDLRELTFRRAAICVRNCIIHLMPSDLLQEVILKAKDTLSKQARDPEAERKAIVDSFSQLHVPIAELESFIGHSLGACSPAELGKLRGIWKSINAGDSAWADYYRRQESVKPETDKASAFGGGAKGTAVERPDDKRACLPTHLTPTADDTRPMPEYLLALIPTVPACDLDAITTALPGLKLGKEQMKIVQAIAAARDKIPATDEPTTSPGPYPPEVLTILDAIAVADTEMKVLVQQQAWISIKSKHATFEAEVKKAISERMTAVKK